MIIVLAMLCLLLLLSGWCWFYVGWFVLTSACFLKLTVFWCLIYVWFGWGCVARGVCLLICLLVSSWIRVLCRFVIFHFDEFEFPLLLLWFNSPWMLFCVCFGCLLGLADK